MLGIQFYPTPENLALKILGKVDFSRVSRALDPSAGKGDLLNAVREYRRWSPSTYAIEIDENLQSIVEKSHTLIDSDFLSFQGTDHFDLIIMNPPFKYGLEHLNKAIDIMYNGQICCILNAETIKNPFSNQRKELINRLNQLNATIEFASDSFTEAERKTSVEIAIVYIDIKNSLEDDFFDSDTDNSEDIELSTYESKELSLQDSIYSKVDEYNRKKNAIVETVMTFHKHHKHIAGYLLINESPSKSHSSKDITKQAQSSINGAILSLRKDYWTSCLELPSIKDKMTVKKREEFSAQIAMRSNMEFTVKNVLSFASKLSSSFTQTIKDSAIELFDAMTRFHAYYPEMRRNILHFNGWKTNDAFKIGKKVILPNYQLLNYYIDYSTREKLNDIDKVMSYFSADVDYTSIIDAVENRNGETRKIKSTFFTISIFQKGTIHLTFNDQKLVDRFNYFVCKNKNWLPHDYGDKPYNDMSKDEKDVVKSFQGEKSYSEMIRDISRGEILALN